MALCIRHENRSNRDCSRVWHVRAIGSGTHYRSVEWSKSGHRLWPLCSWSIPGNGRRRLDRALFPYSFSAFHLRGYIK